MTNTVTDPATLPEDVRRKLLLARQAHVEGDDAEAHHQIYAIACPGFDCLDPWAALEGRVCQCHICEGKKKERRAPEPEAPPTPQLCPHGMPLAENICGPCSEGRPNAAPPPACNCEGPQKMGPGYHAPYCATMAGTDFAQRYQPPAQEPDDVAVDRFAAAMKAKLAKKRDDGKHGWDDPDVCSMNFLLSSLRHHVEKGDPVDVANFAMMIWHRDAKWLDAAVGQLPASGGT